MKTKAKKIGFRRQLFVDDYIVEAMKNVSKTLNQAKKHPDNPLIKPDRPWEPSVHLYGTVLYDEKQQLFRMWYSGGPTGSLYATSKDGLKWEKPNLGLYDYEGSKENNVIPNGPAYYYLVYNPEMYGCEAEERLYKCFRSVSTEKGSGYGVFFSKDGLHWTPYSENPVLTGVGDECPTGATSYGTSPAWQAEYHSIGIDSFPKGVGYGDVIPPKYISLPKIGVLVGKFSRRSVALSTSSDFMKWSKPILILAPDAKDDENAETRIKEALEDGVVDIDHPADHRGEFYHLCVFPYEGMYLGFVDVFYPNAELNRIGQLNQGGPEEVQLVSSRDLIHWERVGNRQPVIPNGKRGDWDRCWKSTTNFPVVVGDELWIYYGGTNIDHGGLVWTKTPRITGIGLATLRLDGFVSVDAGEKEGTLTTKPLVLEGGKLGINAETKGGSVKVEILNEAGKSVKGFRVGDCDTFTGDNVRHTVTWRGSSDVSVLQGKAVKLRFHMKKAKLYSFFFYADANRN